MTLIRKSIKGITSPLWSPNLGQVRNPRAFAALKSDGSVVTWGDAKYGGDSSSVRDELSNNVKQIFSNTYEFAALKKDGSVITWGDWTKVDNSIHNYFLQFGNSLAPLSLLDSDVKTIYTNGLAFAALKNDGSVVTWGSNLYGGNSQKYSHASVNIANKIGSARDDLISDVDKIYPTGGGFVAIKKDGSIITWGLTSKDSETSLKNLKGNVKNIIAGEALFTILTNDNSVIVFGEPSTDSYSSYTLFSEVANDLKDNVSKVVKSGWGGMAALKFDGSVVTWGAGGVGGDPVIRLQGSNGENRDTSVENQLSSGVVDIEAAGWAFAATKSDGTVVTWGDAHHGGDNSNVFNELAGKVKKIYNWGNGFAALLIDGSVVCWGNGFPANYKFNTEEGDMISVANQIKSNVVDLFSTTSAIAALKSDGSVVTWGHVEHGGDSSNVSAKLQSGVTDIFTTQHAFAALKEDGSVVTWGEKESGGDSRNVASFLSSGVVSLATPFADYNIIFKGDIETLNGIKDYDGNPHGYLETIAPTSIKSAYKYQGKLDVNNDGKTEAIFTNKESGRWVTASIDPITGAFDYTKHGQGGTTRIVGIYEDPLVQAGIVEKNSDLDGSRTFINDLKLDNLILKTVGDYDGDGFQEVYWSKVDNTAYLRAVMHADGNIQYANYQNLDQMTNYLTSHGFADTVALIS